MADKKISPVDFGDNRGVIGTDISGGYVYEEHIDTLQGRLWCIEADKMRRSDEIVSGMYAAIKNTLLAATWDFQPEDPGDELSEDIAKELRVAFFENMDKTWSELIDEYCTIILYGLYLAAPKVEMIDLPGYGKRWVIKDLSFRSPKTIERIEIDKETEKIKRIYQQAQGDITYNDWFYFDNMFYISLSKEGNNFWGISPFRGAYGNYYRKKFINKVKLTGIARASLGFPDMTYPSDWKEGSAEYDALKTAMKSFTSDKAQYSLRPEGTNLTMVQIPFDPEKLENVVNSENTNMTYVILADFLMLGRQGGGNRMLGDSKFKNFLKSMAYIAWKFIESFIAGPQKLYLDWNRGAIPEGKSANLTVSGIETASILEMSQTLMQYVNAKLLTPDKTIEGVLRETLDLPPMEDVDDVKEVVESVEKEEEETEEIVKEEFSEITPVTDIKHSGVDKITALESRQELLNLSDDFDFEMAKKMDEMTEKYIREMRKRIIQDGGNIFNVISDLEMPKTKEFELLIQRMLKDSVNKGKNQIKRELRAAEEFAEAKVPDGVFAWVKSNAKATAKQKANALKERIDGVARSMAANYPLGAEIGTDELNRIIDGAKTAGKEYVGNKNNLDGNRIVPFAVGSGRKISAAEMDVIGFEYFNPDPVSAICKQLAGQTRAIDDLASAENDPPNHFNCKSILIPITAAEGEPAGGWTGFNVSGSAARGSKNFEEEIVQ